VADQSALSPFLGGTGSSFEKEKKSFPITALGCRAVFWKKENDLYNVRSKQKAGSRANPHIPANSKESWHTYE